MKNLSLLALLILGFLIPAKADDAIDKAADKTCDCIEKKMDEPGFDNSQMELMLGLCVLQATSPLKSDIMKEFKLDVSKSKDLEKVSKMIGERAVFRCQRFMELVLGIVAEEESADKGKKSTPVTSQPDVATRELVGKVESFECNDVCKIILKEGSRSHTVYLVDDIQGMEIVKKGVLLKGESVELTVEEMDFYSQETKGMVPVYVLRSISYHTD